MGRYYSGDIEGKFRFGVQASDDADFFGGNASEPNEIDYTFAEDDLSDIEAGVAACEAKLGDNKAKLDAFFADSGGWTDEAVADCLDLPHDDYDKAGRGVLAWYARLELGEKILACVKERGACSFTAEP